MNKKIIFSFIIFLSMGFVFSATVDFENFSGGEVITNQFESSHGMIFSSTSHTLKVWQKNSSAYGYYGGPNGVNSLADPATYNSVVGNYFLGANQDTTPVQVVRIDFTSFVQSISGVILDLEGSETSTYTAYGSDGSVIDTLTIPGTSGGNGSVVAWELTSSSSNIAYAIVESRWVAFDNFTTTNPASTTNVPEPASIFLLFAGIICLFYKLR